jgi:hypothetical protein
MSNRGLIPSRGKRKVQHPGWLLGSPSLLYNEYQGLFPYWPTSGTRIKNPFTCLHDVKRNWLHTGITLLFFYFTQVTSQKTVIFLNCLYLLPYNKMVMVTSAFRNGPTFLASACPVRWEWSLTEGMYSVMWALKQAHSLFPKTMA